ncbi:predicted protein [Naegleria gruberi]|uniref:Predicted protein n=1 Tax=Naegleria gruberi TaxID=5762 RepID=D2VN35_NAEGR|nr:uncharacterized protein NAEGRDRAFT_70357 [Naegleria gruberi]EFC41925.1 predicted protein [Naegleria gruberi]|eukprot:XP_002674669.1 predicted protein [Naegleria gruberi strain NEG-M]
MDPSQASDEGEERRRLPSRSTRGKRLTELEGIDKDVDDEFWKMNMFAEDEGDNEFETTEQILEEEQDYEDSDMDEYTSDEEGEQQRANNVEKKIAKEERETKKRKNVYKDESKSKKKKSTDKSAASTVEKQPKTPKAPKTPKTTLPVEMKRSSRQSTVKATEATDEKIKAKTSKTKTPKAPKELKKFTQEELLEEAKITTEENKKSLLKLRQTEEDVKKKARDSKSKMIDPYEPRVKYISKMGTNLIEFVNHGIPQCINQKMPDEEVKRFNIPKEEKQLKCVITGLPAKYIDPLTRKPYANVEAFKELRKMKIE